MKVKNWCLIIVVITISTFESVLCRCEAWYEPLADEATFQCYQQMQNLTYQCTSEITNYKVLKPNKNEGTVDVEFDYDPNCNYTLELRLSDMKDETKNCYKQDASFKRHSKYIYRGIPGINNEVNLLTCTKRATITLKYVYTGCYHIQLETDNSNKVISSRQYFEMSSKKLNYSDFEPEFFVQHRPAHSQTILQIKHPFLKQQPNLGLIILNTNNTKRHYLNLSPILNRQSGVVDYKLCKFSNVSISCSMCDVDEVKCIIDDLDNGLYYITVSFQNMIQCPIMNVIWSDCSLTTKTTIANEVLEPQQSPRKTIPENTLTWIFLGVASVIIVMAILLVIYRFKGPHSKMKSTKSIFIDENPTVEYPVKEAFIGQKEKKVLLLYPNDAESVKKTMEKLRNALRAEGLEVFDIYDKEEQKKINKYGKKWITDKLIEENMKTIIVQTYCGQILANYSDSAEKLYKKPTCYDNLFPYALSLIRGRVDRNSYTKLFIVNMGFDKMEYTQFKFCNPSTRYTLPDSFMELIRDLCDNTEIKYDNSQKSNNELNEFICEYKNMKNDIANLNYLNDILNFTIPNTNDNDNEKDFKIVIDV